MSKALPKQVEAQARTVASFDAQVAKDQTPNPAAPVAPEPAVPAPVAPAPPPAAPEVSAQAFAELDQKYRTLQGMFRSRGEAYDVLAGRLEEALKAIANLQERANAPAKPETPRQPLVTKADEDQFGADVVDLARRVAREEFGTREEAYQKQIAELRAALGGTQQTVEHVQQSVQKSAHQTFFEGLDEKVPGWEGIQKSPECQQWLGGHVPGTDLLWNDVLVAAAEQANLDKAIEVFTAYLRENPKARKQPAPAPTPPTPPAPPAPKPVNPLEAEVTPARTAGDDGSRPGPTQKRAYKAKEYEAESMRIVRLRQIGHEAEAAALEAELNAALREGRIVP